MRILVTGANGFIGSKLVKTLCDKNVDVIATDFNSNNIDERATFCMANIFDPNVDWFNFFDKPDICIHLAWRDGFVHNSCNHMGDLSSHFLFLKNLIDSGISKVACLGTMHEVGYWEGVIDENTPCAPLSLYGVSKNALRKSLELYTSQSNCMFQWLRCFYIYGDDKNGNSIFCKIRKASENGISHFPFTSGKNKYDFIHIDDLTEQIAACVLQDNILGIINCCSGKPISLADKVEDYIKENCLNISLDYGAYPDRIYDSPCLYGDNSKIRDIKTNSNY